MDRNKLICAHFDAYSDLAWVTNVEPKYKAALWDAGEIELFRQAWQANTEARDWDRWQEKVKGMTDAELQRDIAECRAQIDAFRKGLTTDRERFRRIMESKDDRPPAQEAVKDRGREM
jgi:hypothetical protein